MELPQIKALVEKALADGVLTQREMDEIMAAIMADDRVSSEEMEILDLIEQKVLNNEIHLT